MLGIITKIKAALTINKYIKLATKEVKTMEGVKVGWKTTEFWGKSLIQLITLYNTLIGGHIDPQLGLTIVAALEGVYGGGRSLVKAVKELVEGLKKKPA